MMEADPTAPRPYRLAYLQSHPIQYHAPLFRLLAARPEIELTVLFCSEWGLRSYRDAEFGRDVKWDVPLLDGYRSEVLPNWSPKPSPSSFFGVINPSVIPRIHGRDFDAVVVHGWATFTNSMTIFSALVKGVPILMRGDTNPRAPIPPLKSALKRMVLTRLFRQISGFLASGRYNREFYEAYGVPKDRIFHVPLCVDNDRFFSQAELLLPKKAELKQQLGIPADVPTILYSGKLVPRKRPMDLLKAFHALSQGQDVALVVLGEGPERAGLEQYVRENNRPNVYFVGFRNQSEVAEFFALADIFVLPSGFEPWGLVVNEAMCFGLPVVVSDQVGAAGDLVRHGINGFGYPVGDVHALATYLRQLVADPAERQRMGEASRQLIKQWSFAEDVQGILSCLEKLLGPRGAGAAHAPHDSLSAKARSIGDGSSSGIHANGRLN